MKSYFIFIFFGIVTLIYSLVNWFVVSRGIKALEGTTYTTIFKWTYWLLASTFVIGQILERGTPTLVGRIITNIGSVWLAVFFYLLIFLLVVDIVRLFDYWFHFIPIRIIPAMTNGQLLFIIGICFSLLISTAGYINARYPRVHTVDIQIDKSIPGKKELKVVLVTDIHMGAMIGNNRVAQMVESINSLHPDMVLFGGDLVDHNPLFVKAEDMGKNFLKLNAPLGVYAVAGNHEFIGHAEISIDYLQKFGIRYIREETINVNNMLLIAGRDDREKVNFNGRIPRKKMEEIIDTSKPELPLILMDHQPVEYSKAEKMGVDLMVSGHTHKGQLWPFGFITNAIFENDFGLMQKGKTWFYTSSGYGTWGPPIRTGNRPEIVEFRIKFK